MKTIIYKDNKALVHVGSRKYLAPSNILQLESKENYTLIHLVNGKKILSSTTLKTIENRLKPFKTFIRINRQSVVNLNLTTTDKELNVILPNKVMLRFSRRRARLYQMMDK